MTQTDTAAQGPVPAGDRGQAERAALGDGLGTHPDHETTRSRRRFLWLLLAITLGGLVLRLAYLLIWRNPWEIVGDAYYYHHGANLLADGEGYVHPYRFLLYGVRMPGADHPPAFLTVLAGFSWLGLRTYFQHQVVSCVLGALGVTAMGLAGRRIAGERVGLIVAGLTAISPNVFFFDPVVVSETLVISTTGVLLLCAYRWWDRPGLARAAMFGASVGLAALVRSEALLLGPAIALPLVWFRRRDIRWLPQLALAGGLAALVIAPWVGHNMARFEEPTTLSAQFDQTLGTANCDDVYYGDRVGYWSLPCIQRTEHLVGDGDASAQGRGFSRIAREYMRDNADRVPYVVAARVGRTVGLYQPQGQIELDLSVETKAKGLGQAGLLTWYAVVIGSGFGLVLLRRAGRPTFPLVATVASVIVTVAVVYGTTRFRLPAELALMIPAAVGLDAALQALGRARHRRKKLPATEPPANPPANASVNPPANPSVKGPGAPARRFAGFDGLRAIAAFGVLVTHVGLHSGFVGRSPTGPWLSRADVGVAMFFALSGFLLYRPFVAARLDGRPPSRVRHYLRKRFLRIFPAYWLALTVLVVVLDVRGRNDITGPWDFVMYYGLLQSYSGATALGGLQQAWTLTNEIAFYLLLPLWAIGAAWLVRRIGLRRATMVEAATLATAAFAALGFRFWLHSFQANDPSVGQFDPRFHWIVANFHLFVPGMALALALEWSTRREQPFSLVELVRRHPLVCWAGSAICFWAVSTQIGLELQIGATSGRQAMAKEVLYGAIGFFALLPVAVARGSLPRSMRWLGSRLLVTLGLLSYGIYLWHEGITDIYQDIRGITVMTGSFATAAIVTVVGSVALAGLSYVLVERPALDLKTQRGPVGDAWRPVGLPTDVAAVRT